MKKLRLGIIGNSHIAALKLAWPPAGTACDRFDPVFFAATGKELDGLEIAGDALVPRTEELARSLRWTSHGQASIRPSDFDLLLTVGLYASRVAAISIFREYQLTQFPLSPQHHPISKACLEEAVFGALRSSSAVLLVEKLRRLTTAPIYYVEDPHPRSRILNKSGHSSWKTVEVRELAFSLHRRFLENWTKEAGLQWVQQPPRTIVDGIFTAEEYMVDSIEFSEGLTTRHTAKELFHANPHYGVVLWQQLLPLMLAEQDGPTPAVSRPESPSELSSRELAGNT